MKIDKKRLSLINVNDFLSHDTSHFFLPEQATLYCHIGHQMVHYYFSIPRVKLFPSSLKNQVI